MLIINDIFFSASFSRFLFWLQLHKILRELRKLKRENTKDRRRRVVETVRDFIFIQYRGGRQLEQLGKQNWEEPVREFLSYHYQHFLYIRNVMIMIILK